MKIGMTKFISNRVDKYNTSNHTQLFGTFNIFSSHSTKMCYCTFPHVINSVDKSSFPLACNQLKSRKHLYRSKKVSFGLVCKKLVLKLFLLTGQPLHCQPNLNKHQVINMKNSTSISIRYISISIKLYDKQHKHQHQHQIYQHQHQHQVI